MTKQKHPTAKIAQNEKLAALRAEALDQMGALYRRFRKPRDRGDQAFAAMFALDLSFGVSTRLNPDFPADREEQEHSSIPVPLWALQHVLQAFWLYHTSDTGRTFGEVLGLEGGGQGHRPAKQRLWARSARLMLARMVYARRASLKAAGKPKEASLEKVFQDISERTNYSTETVRAAWREFGHVVPLEFQDNNFEK